MKRVVWITLLVGLPLLILASLALQRKTSLNNLKKVRGRNIAVVDEINRWDAHFNKMPDEQRLAKGSGYKQFKRWEWYITRRLNDDGTYPQGARWNAYVDMVNARRTQEKSLLKTGAAANWTVMGPAQNSLNSAGRMLDIAFDPNDSDVIWAGSASGGAWKSADAGASWTPMGDDMPSLAVSCIVVHNTNSDVIYIGTGEVNGSADCIGGAGILKSTDGGATWSTTGYSADYSEYWTRVSELVMDETDPDILIAATNTGVFRTTDGGDNWTETLDVNFAKDIVFHPTNHNTVYVSVGYHWGSTNNGIYKSTDNGVNWTKLTSGLPADWDDTGRISLAISKSNPSILYSYISKLNQLDNKGVYKTTDGGENWTKCNGDPAVFGGDYYSWYANVINIDPDNPDVVYCGSADICRTTNGGNNWIPITQNGDGIHVDMHAFEFHPSTGHLWAGCDGGIYRTTNGGNSWDWRNQGLITMQFYAIGLDPADENYAYGGTQDQGTNQYEGTLTWDHIRGGDGGEVVVDYTDGNILYTEYQNGSHQKSYDRGDTWTSINNGLDGGPWVTPVEMDPVNPLVLYTISDNNLYRTTNGGSNWSLFYETPENANSCIRVAPNDNQTIYVCGGDYIYKTTDGGGAWSDISSGIPADGDITYIAVHPGDSQTLYITKSGWTEGYHIYKSSDGGSNWTNITGNLVNMPCWSIVIDSSNTNHLYVGHELGVHMSQDGGATWIEWNTNLPNVVVDEIAIHLGSRKIRAGTHGRGMWESPLAHDIVSDIPLLSNKLPTEFALRQNYPNPFNPKTVIGYQLSDISNVNITIYDRLGRKLASLVNERQPAGIYTIEWNAESFPSGIYFYRLSAGSFTEVRKCMLLK